MVCQDIGRRTARGVIAMPVFRDRRVGILDQLGPKDAQLVVCREALRRGALTSTELASRSGPAEVVRVSLGSVLWPAPVAAVYFHTAGEAHEWAQDLLDRLPRIDDRRSSARSPVWRLEMCAANVIRESAAASLARWRVVGGPVLAVLEPDDATPVVPGVRRQSDGTSGPA
jgi:hypothetical protein